jgi:hypothetical protein
MKTKTSRRAFVKSAAIASAAIVTTGPLRIVEPASARRFRLMIVVRQLLAKMTVAERSAR